MKQRVVSGLIGIGLFLGLCFAGLLPFTVFVTLLAFLAAKEWDTAYAEFRTPVQRGLTFLGVAFPLLAFYISQNLPHLLPLYATERAVVVLIFAALTFRAARKREVWGRYQKWYGAFGYCYLGSLFSSFVLVRALPGRLAVGSFPQADRGAWLLLLVAVCVWATDTLAYFVGRSLGRHKLAPSLSPAKTIEGSLGGLCGALTAGAAFGTLLGVPLVQGLLIGAIAGIMGQIGDLFESALKRERNLKDFGSVMPGHGGILDRFDSLLFVMPLACLVFYFFVPR